eukprot:8071139-Pyramimonas_sp.AAC.2
MLTYKRDDEWKVLSDTQYPDKRAYPNINAANETAMENNGWDFEYEQQRTDTTRAEPEWTTGKGPEQIYTNKKKTEHGAHKNT